MKFLLLFSYFLIFTFLIFAQPQSKIDSLKLTLKSNISVAKKGNSIHQIAVEYLYKNDDSALKYIGLDLEMAKASKDFLAQGRAHGTHSTFLNDHGNFDLAITEILKSIDFFEKIKDMHRLGGAYNTIGYTYKRMADAQKINSFSEKGLNYVVKGISILKNANDYKGLVKAYVNLGIIQRDLKDFKGAKKSFLEGLEITKKHEIDNISKGVLNADLGQNYIDFGKDFDTAIYYLKKSITYYEISDYKKGIEHAHRNLADAYRMKNNLNQALIHSNKSVEIAKTLNDNHRLFNAYNTLVQVNEASGNYKEAFENLKIAKRFEDSTLKVQKLRSIAEVETKYQTVKKEAEIGVLGEKNKAQNRQLWFLLAGLVLALGFIGAIYWQNQKIKASEKLVLAQADQLKLMMKELHHRVKNNLAIVSGLLRIQSNKLEDESAIQAVRQGQQRVDAMSLIHQRLYQTDKVTTVNIKEYIIDLAESLMSAYGFEPNEFALNISVEKEEMDVDLAIPLGLIINELLTNSFKYAYFNIDKPALNISLKGDKNLNLEIKDNGVGIDLERWKNAKNSFGKKMIAGLVNQIGGKFTIENDGGTVFKMKIAA